MAGRLAHDIAADGGIAGAVEIDGLGAAHGIGLIGGIALGFQHRQRGQPVQRAGIQMREPEMLGQLLGQGAFATGCGAVNGDDNAHALLTSGGSKEMTSITLSTVVRQ